MSEQQTLFLCSLFITHTGSILEAADPATCPLKILSPQAHVLPCARKMRSEAPVQEKGEADRLWLHANLFESSFFLVLFFLFIPFQILGCVSTSEHSGPEQEKRAYID